LLFILGSRKGEDMKKISVKTMPLLILSFFILMPTQNALAKPPYKHWKLKNGLEIITLESHKVPLITIALTAKAGAMTETPKTNGLTHLWEHMFFKGNEKIPSQDKYLKRIRQLGISFNGSTSAEKVNYYFTLPSVFMTEGLEFMADAIQRPLISETELAKEKGVVLNEYQRRASSPQFTIGNLTRYVIYGAQQHQRNPIGLKENISSATREQLLKIKDEVFVPANSALIVGGDFDEKKLIKAINQFFADWKNPKDWKYPKRPKIPDFPKSQSYTVTNPQAATPSIKHIFEGPKARFDQKDSFAADVLIGLLGQKAGKFYRKFIDSGLTLHTGLSYYTQSHAGKIVLYSQLKAENLVKSRKLLLKEPKEWLKKDYFSKTEIENVRRKLLIDHKRDLNKPSEYVKRSIGFWWAVTGLNYYGTYLDNLRNTELEDVRKFVKKYLVGKNHISTTLISPKDAKKIGLKDDSIKLQKKLLKSYL